MGGSGSRSLRLPKIGVIDLYNNLVVLQDGIKAMLLQLLPVTTQIIFVVGIEQQQEVLDDGDHLLQLEVRLTHKEVECVLLQLPDGVLGFLVDDVSDLLMQLQNLVVGLVVFLHHNGLKYVVVDDPEVPMKHQEHLEEGEETFPFFLCNITDLPDLHDRESLLRDREDRE